MENTDKKAILQIENLTKYFGSRQILKDVSFETYAGEVFGFLGPNGAGKTTTIKIVTGLLSIDSGNVVIDGYDLNKKFEKALAKMGAIVENPEMYKYLSGLENLKQYARIRTIDGKKITKERIDEVVELVRLKNRINDKVSKYSLGMRQRLGVAQALLHKPSLLILDEPTNGLDPAGIKELRDVLKEVAHKENIAVMVSSHLMSEMELMCDRVGIIVNGELISVQTVDELISSWQSDKKTYLLSVDNKETALEALKSITEINVNEADEGIKVELPLEKEKELLSKVNSAVILAGVQLYATAPVDNKKLEDVFIELTKIGGEQIG